VWAKSQGITTRATAIADAAPALFVGGASSQNNLAGVAPFALNAAAPFWIGGDDQVNVQVNDDGTFTAMAGSAAGQAIGKVVRVTHLAQDVGGAATTINIVSPDGFPVEEFTIAVISGGQAEFMLVPQASNENTFNTTTWTVERGASGTAATAHSAGDMVIQVSGASFGQTVTFPSTNDPNQATRMQGRAYPPADLSAPNQTAIYAPLYVRDPRDPVDWIVAFGWVTLSVTSSGPPVQLTLRRGNLLRPNLRQNNGSIAPVNAMAVPASRFAAIALLNRDQADTNALFSTLFQARAGVSMPVRAPALVRSE
jgi:hypothetical protein